MSRLSLAQTLPPELLTRVFGWLVEIRSGETPDALRCQFNDLVEWPWTANVPDLRDCALVCRRWRPQAQQMLFRSIPLYKVGGSKLLDRLQNQPDLAATVRALDVQLDSKDFVRDLECGDYASAMQRAETLCIGRLSILELCTRACHVVIGGVAPSQRERLVGILDDLHLKSLIYSEREWDGNWPTQRGLVYLSVLELCSLAQRPSLQNFEVNFRRTRPAYNPLLPPSPASTRPSPP